MIDPEREFIEATTALKQCQYSDAYPKFQAVAQDRRVAPQWRAEALLGCGAVMERTMHCDAARRFYDLAIEMHAGCLGARLNLVNLAFYEGRIEESLDALEKLNAEHPNNPHIRYKMAIVFLTIGWLEDGFENLKYREEALA